MGNINNDTTNMVTVSFTHTNTGRTEKINIEKNTKFDDVINVVYEKLGESRKGTDNFYSIDGVFLNDQLDKIVQVVINNKCKEAKFEIKGSTGGA